MTVTFWPVTATASRPSRRSTDERSTKIRRTPVHGMFPIAGILPPNILPDEILKGGERRIRAAFADSCNPVLTWPDTPALTAALQSLDLLVVVDVAMTETARLAHYILPAASQFEKCEATGFNLEFAAARLPAAAPHRPPRTVGNRSCRLSGRLRGTHAA